MNDMEKILITIDYPDGTSAELEVYQFCLIASTDDDLPSNPDTMICDMNPIFGARAIDKVKGETGQ